MKKLLVHIVLLVMAVLSWSCSVREDVGGALAGSVFRAVADAADGSRAFLDSEMKIEWDAKDSIALFADGRKALAVASNGGLEAIFTSDASFSAGAVHAIYPYSEAVSFQDGAFTASIDSEQVAVPGSFAKGANLAIAYSLTDQLRFRNAVSFIKVSFRSAYPQARIRKITFESIDPNAALSGDIRMFPQVKDGELTSILVGVENGCSRVSVVAAPGESLVPGADYYIAAAPSVLSSGYRIIITDEDGLSFSREYPCAENSSAILRRNMIEVVGRKNIDAYTREMDCYSRLTSDADFIPGRYMIARKMGNDYRIFNDMKTDPFISSGTPLVDKFFNTAYSAANNSNKASILLDLKNDIKRWPVKGAPDFISDYVHYALRSAWDDSSDPDSKVAYVSDSFILNPEDACTVTMDDSRTMSMWLHFMNSETHKADSAEITIAGCTASIDASYAVLLRGTMTEAAVDEMLRVLYVGKGDSFMSSAEEYDLRTPAMNATTVTTTFGFCTIPQVTVDGESMNEMFMISNKFLCSSPTTMSRVALYRKDRRLLSFGEVMDSRK
ncbi:MAG: hypothetical protein MJY86_08915 [Bacteroidales bacterium]|nr:hypothetical protein [Bacteroidales bacterium]